jgi:hypothetical protein
MKIYAVIHSTNRSMSPVLETSYHLTKEEGLTDFNDRVQSVGDDYASICLEEFDPKSKKVTVLESFEGNEDD